MKIIDRYILKELLRFFILGLGILTSVLFLDKVLYMTEMIINKGIGISVILRLMIFLSPAFLVITIPMAVLVASLITFSRLSADNEIIAMSAHGLSFYRLLFPVMILSLLAYIATNLLMIYALPYGTTSFRRLVFKSFSSNANYEIKERIFNSDFEGLVIYINEKSASDSYMKGIFIADSRTMDRPHTISASEGRIRTDKESMKVTLHLKDGTIHTISEDRERYQLLTFNTYDLSLDIPNTASPTGKLLVLKGIKEMPIKEIRERINRLKREKKSYSSEMVELYKKFSIPINCFILGIIGAPLGIKSRRAGKYGSFAISLAIILFYYLCMISGESLGKAGNIPPLLATWTPNVIVGIVGIFLVFKTARE
ncbi:MAG: LPS export ABC transporter permease LptF [Nitrospinota bacterium]